MPRSVGEETTPGRGIASFVARHPRALVVAFVLFVVVSTQGAAAETATPTATGATQVGP